MTIQTESREKIKEKEVSTLTLYGRAKQEYFAYLESGQEDREALDRAMEAFRDYRVQYSSLPEDSQRMLGLEEFPK